MKILNYNKEFPLDYIKRVHEDFMTPIERTILQEEETRKSLMKLIGNIKHTNINHFTVMRKVHEIR